MLPLKNHEIERLIVQESERMEHELNLIASENYPSQAIMAATGSVLTSKYAEGYPGRRYYAGCSIVDQVELKAIEWCKQLFHAEHANVQPHAGSQANMAVYFSVLKPGDTILGMELSSGGHLTHGSPVSFSGKLYNVVTYGVDRETELIDYQAVEEIAKKVKPRIIIAGASAYARVINFERFAQIAADVEALLVVDIAHIAGLVAAGLHPSPVPYADFVTSTTHKTLRGPRGAFVLCKQSHAALLDASVMPGIQGGPFMNVIAAKAIAFQEAMKPSFALYQQQIIMNAQALCNALKDLGYRMVSGGTDNHLMIVDLTSQNIGGKEAEQALEKAGIIVSRSTIPFDTKKPAMGSGIRLGTPAMTTRGMGVGQTELIAEYIHEALMHRQDESFLQSVREKVAKVCSHFPIYPK
jgi:glycine hydroxymethyltransferase